MQYLYPFSDKKAVKIEILYVKCSTDFTCTVIMNSWPAGSISAVGNIKLVTVTPWTTLLNLNTFICNMPATKIIFDKSCDGALFYKGCEHLDRKSEVR